MEARALTPILNVSDIAGHVRVFEKWGWKKLWDWGTPPRLAPSDRARRRVFFFIWVGKGAEAEAQIQPL